MAETRDDDDSGPKLVCSAEVDTCVLRLLQDFYREQGTVAKIDTHTWKRWEIEMSQFFLIKPPYRKLKSKRDQMIAVYRACEALLDTSGVSWDPINKVVECSNETWFNYVAVILLS